MYFYILASGSKGNCAIVGSQKTKLIIDCGATKAYLMDAFDQVRVDPFECDGLLITHNHSDHIKNVRTFMHNRVYATFPIMSIGNEQIITPLQPFQINDLTILPIPLSHDAENTVGYIITDGKETLVQLTDTGYISKTNFDLIKGADYYIFESNHDPEMLMATNRPMSLKQRILSDSGHLSNQYASDVLARCISKRTKEIILAHISQEANSYELAYYTLKNTLLSQGLLSKQLKIKAIEQYEIYAGGNR